MTKKILINTSQQAPMQVDENGDTLRQVFGPTPKKKRLASDIELYHTT